jgi:hypothetical protein
VALSISLAVLLLIIVIMLVKKSGLKGAHAVICVLLGFYLSTSSIAPTINDFNNSVVKMIGDLKL